MSQMTVTEMSIIKNTDSPQHKLHWLAEQALTWSGLPVVTVRPTVFLEGFFLRLAAMSVRENDELALPLSSSRTSPISAIDVANVVSAILDSPAPHIGNVYNLTGAESADLVAFESSSQSDCELRQFRSWSSLELAFESGAYQAAYLQLWSPSVMGQPIIRRIELKGVALQSASEDRHDDAADHASASWEPQEQAGIPFRERGSRLFDVACGRLD
jgi:hypothetical protein